MWKVEYSYDGVEIGDLFPIVQDGFTWGKQRNTVTQTKFKVSLRQLKHWCDDKSFDYTKMFTPIKSSVKVVQVNDDFSTGQTVGGWLSSRPGFTLDASADVLAEFTFSTWLGLTAGGYIIPPLAYNDHFDVVAETQIELMVERTIIAGAPWPLTVGVSDELAIVEDTLEAPKSLKDFLLERADNTEGTGTFDVYDDPNGQITLYEKYGLDISDSTTFSYPDSGSTYALASLGFAEWDNFVSDVFLTGAGNGYSSSSGAEGAAIFSEARNEATIANTGYWQIATSESDISVQETLDAKATSYVKDTDKPFDVPVLGLDGDKFRLYSREQGGDLWLGDTIMVDTYGWAEQIVPVETPLKLRIDSLTGTVDGTGHCSVGLGMVADV